MSWASTSFSEDNNFLHFIHLAIVVSSVILMSFYELANYSAILKDLSSSSLTSNYWCTSFIPLVSVLSLSWVVIEPLFAGSLGFIFWFGLLLSSHFIFFHFTLFKLNVFNILTFFKYFFYFPSFIKFKI